MSKASHDPRPDWAQQLYGFAAKQWLPRDRGCTLVPLTEGVSGSREVILLEPGLVLLAGNLDYPDGFSVAFETDDAAKFHFRLSGKGALRLDGEDQLPIGEHTGSMLVTRAGHSKEELVAPGQHERSVTVICMLDRLVRLLGELETTPSVVSRSLAAGQAWVPFALTPEMAAAVQGLLDCRLSGSLRMLYARGRVMELLALSLASLAVADQDRDEMPERDVRRISEAHDILCASWVPNITIQELARRVGTNEAKLMQGFKRLYGQTIIDFCQTRRMDHARHLLEESAQSITEIAFEVGYEYPSNFTTAFKRQFGVTPKAARRGYGISQPES
ncbi:MAG: helix-turn-helix transcriptional regulator [Pseudomonadales bacterium]|nr:helix-turn-helix transcriptional regulator [Pseudomonadales bacterium]MCP5183538.1 helix-turn-helix transcriptional regulator [Pseudomonadales bacterium]